MPVPTFLFLASLFLTDLYFTNEETLSTETTHEPETYSKGNNFTKEEIISTETTQGTPHEPETYLYFTNEETLSTETIHEPETYSKGNNFTKEEIISTETTQGTPHEPETCWQAVTELNVNAVNDVLKISWKDHDLYFPTIYGIQITHLRKEFCGGKDEKNTETVKQKTFIYNDWNGFAPLKVCVQDHEFRNLSCQKKSCIRVPSNISGALDVVDFQLLPKTNRIKAKWKPNPLWSSECSLQAYSLSLINEYKEKLLNENVSSTSKKLVFKELKPKKYNILIQPIFDNGKAGTIRSKEAIPCPQSVTELDANLRKNVLSITWKDHKLNSQSEYKVEVTHLRKEFCGGENTIKRKVTKWKIYNYSQWNGFAPLNVCVQHHGFENLSCQKESCSRITSLLSGALDVVDFQLVPQNNMIKAQWRPNPLWSSECRLKSYRLSSTNNSWEKVPEECVSHNYCEETIKNLPQKQYSFSIQPIFINGKAGTVRSKEATLCPQPVSDLNIHSRNNVLSITWKDHYLNLPAVYEVEITHLRKEFCGGENSKDRKLTQRKIFSFIEWNGFAPLNICVQHHGFEKLSCQMQICTRVSSGLSGALDVVDFQLISQNNMIKAQWRPNPLWSSECRLKSYRLSSIKESWEKVLEECVSHNYCEETIKDLQPKQYSLMIQPIFTNGKAGTVRSEEATPCPQPVSDLNIHSRNNVLSITWKDHYLNSPAVYEVEITHLRKEFCGEENTKKRKLTKWKIYKYSEWNGFAPLNVCVQHHGFENLSCQKESCSRITSLISGALDVADFQLVPLNNMIRAHWRPNPLWSSECRLKSYRLSSINQSWEKILDKCVPFNYCEETIKNLQPMEYSFSIQPIFVNGKVGSVRTEEAIPCPKAISNIETEEKGQSLEITWSDIDLNPSFYIVQISQLRYRLCGGKNKNSSMLISQKRFLYQKFNPLIPLMICVQHNLKSIQKDTSCQSVKCTQIQPVHEIPNMVKKLKSTPKETSIEITWEIPQEWNEFCQLQSFKVSEKTSSKSVIYNKQCPMNLCTYSMDGLMEDTYYKFSVSAKFRYFKEYPIPPSVEVTTLQKYPQTPDEALKVNSDVSLAYNVHDYLSRNCSCKILLKNVKNRQTLPYNCLNGQGNITIPSGKEYNISYKICNSRGCNSSSIKQMWSRPIVNGEVVVLEDSKDHITFLLPSFGDYLTGFVYLMVASVGHSSLTKSITISYVKNLLKQEESSQRPTRSISGTPAEEGMIIWHSKLSLTTYRYDLLAKDLGDDVSHNGIYVATGYVIGAGKNRKVGATDFTGPYFFTSNPVAVICSIIFMVLLTFLLLGTIIYLWQRKNSRMQRSSRQTLSDETLMEMLKTSPTEKSKDASYQNSAKEQNSVLNELAQIQNKKRDMDCVFLNDLSAKKHLLKVANDSSNSSENEYSNLEPDLFSEGDLETYLISAAHSEALVTEFKNIPLLIPGKSMTVATQPGCKEKNRYRNIIPYDDTRVILPLFADDHSSHYINANFIEIYVGMHGQKATYIAAQGPMQKSSVISDFWRMVWYQKIKAIVMLTSLIEDNKVKCDQYWPEKDKEMHFKDDILVRNEGFEDKEFFVVRHLTLIRNLETRKVTQYHYTKWPDHNVPCTASPLAQLVNLLRSEHCLGPTVIHCSAGIGRTGCLLLVLMALEEIEMSQPLKMKDFVLQLRNCRGRLIQTAAQYQFAHYLLWTILYEVQSTFPPEEFGRISEELLDAARPNDLENSSLLVQQFQWLKNLPNDLTYLTATNENIRYFYNRFENIFPADTKKIELTIGGNSLEERYINAIAVNGFNQKGTYIVTEYPTMRTIERVWLMIFEKQLSVWILLNEMDTQIEQDYPSIIPDESTAMTLNQVTIELLSKSTSSYFEESKVRIYVYLKNAATVDFDCCVIQLRGWYHKNSMPSLGPDSLLDMLHHAYDRNSLNNSFLVTCLDGVTACGLTLALDITRRRLETLGEINILSSCVDICYARPEFIISLEQFSLLYSYIAKFKKRGETIRKTNKK